MTNLEDRNIAQWFLLDNLVARAYPRAKCPSLQSTTVFRCWYEDAIVDNPSLLQDTGDFESDGVPGEPYQENK